MVIISHRGYWKEAHEKNSKVAFERSFSLGFGTETDIRDYQGELVISHDIPDSNAMKANDFFYLYRQYQGHLPLALNVKSDGLQKLIKELLNKHAIRDYFFFDMSIPDTLGYFQHDLTALMRLSEYEKPSELWQYSQGVWLDGFKQLNFDVALLTSVLDQGKYVCIVSPELHQREHLPDWHIIKQLPLSLLNSQQLILCTDKPEEAEGFFYG